MSDAVRAYRALERAHIEILPMIAADGNEAIYRAWDMLQQAMDGLWWTMPERDLDVLRKETQNMTADFELSHRFKYHSPDDQKKQRHESIRAGIYEIARTCNDLLPVSREASLCLTKLEEALFWANAAIARHSLPEDKNNA